MFVFGIYRKRIELKKKKTNTVFEFFCKHARIIIRREKLFAFECCVYNNFFLDCCTILSPHFAAMHFHFIATENSGVKRL